MATAEELLNSVLKNEASVLSATDAVFVIDGESRTINVPDSERLFGVEGDKDVERKYFQCPKIVGDNIDLSQHQIYVSYAFTTTENSTSFPDADGLYHCEDVEVSGDNITFSWLLSGNVFANPGFIAFKVMAKKSEGEELKTKWNTAPAYGSVLITVPDGESIAEKYPDVINQIIERLDTIDNGGATEEKIQQAVEDYLTKNPIKVNTDTTLTQSGIPADAKATGDEISKKLNKSGWNSNKYLGTDESGNVIEKEDSGTSGGNSNLLWKPTVNTSGDISWTKESSDTPPDTVNIKGQTGATPNIQIGQVTTLEPGQQATASMSGTPENPLLNLGIPKGEKGDPGDDSGSGESYKLPIMSDTQLGGGKAVEKTDEDVPVAVDPLTGQLFVPTYPENTGGGGGTVDPEQIKQAVNGYLEENPPSGMTAEQEQQLNQNTLDVADLRSALTELGNNYKSEYFLLKSPNGQVYKITITNSGEIISTVFSGGLPDIIPGRLLLWSDEFDSDNINTEIWGFEQGYIRNNEKQYYVSDEKNAYVSDSILHIVALKDNPYSGYEWSSASLDSQLNEKKGFSYGYGLIEIKARCTTAYSGVWPAFWSRGASQPGEGWPMCGEIDIGELFYNGDSGLHRYNPGIFWYDWHSLMQKSQKSTDTGLSSGKVIYQNVDTEWHYYGLERNENEMIFYFDRNEISRISLKELTDSDINCAMKQPMSVKLNLAMGSIGGEIPSNLTKAEYEIDYVRYYAPAGIVKSTDSGEWEFPDYMPSELGYSKTARIVPDRKMNDGKNQFLYWESSNPVIASVDSGLITTYEQTGNVDISMHDVFGNTKTVNLSVKEGADCKSTEVREIPTNPNIVPWGEKIDILVRLVPNWVTNHDVLASLSPTLDRVSVNVKKSTHSIAKYTTECSIIELENNSILLEDTEVNLKVTAKDSGVFLDIPLTIKKAYEDFNTYGMYAAYLYEYADELEDGVGQINDLTHNNKNPIANLYYTASNNNGICRISGKGIQSQVQGGYFNPRSAEGFFLEKFDKNRTLTFVFNIMSGSTEMRGAYNSIHGLLSVCHEGIGHNVVSNTVDGRHGLSFGIMYNDNTENGFILKNAITASKNQYGFVSSKLMSNENEIMPENINTEYLHKDNFIYSVVLVYDSYDKSMASHIVVNGKILATLYNGLKYAISQTNFDKNVFETIDTTISEEILQEDNDKPFYWRYGNGGQVCSDFVRAICVYDKTLSKEEMISIDSILTNRYL